MCAAMRSPTPRTPRIRVPRRRIEEALLEERLGLCEEWIERWEQGGKCFAESLAPAALPPFIHATLGRHKVYRVEEYLNRLVAAGCSRPVLYFCLEELSPEAAAKREGRRRLSVPEKDGEYRLLDERDGGRPLATREEMEAVRNKAIATRRRVRRYRRELLLVADTQEVPPPSGMTALPEDTDDALALAEESLDWVANLAGAYTAPFEKTLLKSKGLLYLTAYVLRHADPRKVAGGRRNGVDKAHAGLVRILTKRKLSPSDLRAKLRKFERDYPRLHRLLVRKLDELHRFHAPK
jgi:hypothetical protein